MPRKVSFRPDDERDDDNDEADDDDEDDDDDVDVVCDEEKAVSESKFGFLSWRLRSELSRSF